jgi:carboxylesterase type B
VTVFGESAGGGSIFHQITAYGGLNGRAPFKKAIMQSPAWANIPSAHQQEAAYTKFLEILNVKTLDEARNLPSLQLRMANAIQVAMSAYGQFTFGPLVDGVFTPALPQRLLLQGSYDKSVKIMVGHNGDEGLLFANPLTDSTDKLDALLLNAFPGIQPDVVDYITNTLYPAVFDGSKNYTTQFQRQRNILADSSFVCNWWYLNQAFKDQCYAYIFNVFPAIHGQDIGFTWDDGYSAPSFASVMTAQIFQQFLTSYALTGKPEIRDLPNMKFTPYGTSGQHITQFTAQAVTDVVDPTDSMACAWWQKSLYY